MVENTHLLKVQKALKNFFTYFKEDNILVISEDKTTAPFAYIINDATHPTALLLSVSIDYPHSNNVAEIALASSSVRKTQLSDCFFISSVDGSTYFEEEAFERWELESLDLSKVEPLSKNLH